MKSDLHPAALLPWYVSRTLGSSELEEVERHLETCEECRVELAFLEKLRDQVKSQDVQPPTDLGLRRLLRDIKAERAAKAPQRWRRVSAAAIVLIAIQTGFIANLWLKKPDRIVPLGETPKEGIVLQVRFAPDTPEARIRSILQELGAVFVDGPSANGLYHLRLTKNSGEEAVRQRITQLRASGIVEHVAQE